MRTSSAKAKGLRLCAETKALIHQFYPQLGDDDVIVRSSGSNGEDLILSPAARALLPIVCEAKNQESLNIWASLKQAEGHLKGLMRGLPTLVFRRNRSEIYVAMKLKDLLKLTHYYRALITLAELKAEEPLAPEPESITLNT